MRNEYSTYFQVFLKVKTIIPPSEVKTACKTVSRKVFCIQLFLKGKMKVLHMGGRKLGSKREMIVHGVTSLKVFQRKGTGQSVWRRAAGTLGCCPALSLASDS